MPPLLTRGFSSHAFPLLIIAVLTFAACGGGSSKPKATEPPDVGSYEDPFDFEGFAQDLDEAVADNDLRFFLESADFEDVPCSSERPSPPAACAGRPVGTSLPAVLLGIWESDDRYLDEDQYESFIREFLDEYADDVSDAYGSGEPRLYAYAIVKPELQPSPATGEAVEAIVTRIGETESGTQREALLISAGFDGDRWAITRLTSGPATFLEPSGPQPTEGAADGAFEFWRRWED